MSQGKEQCLAHVGVLGMKWGVRRNGSNSVSRETAIRRSLNGPGPRTGLTKKRTKEMAKRDLEFLDKGGHLSIGLTKSKQAKYDERDRRRLEQILNNPEQINNGKMFVKKLLSKTGG